MKKWIFFGVTVATTILVGIAKAQEQKKPRKWTAPAQVTDMTVVDFTYVFTAAESEHQALNAASTHQSNETLGAQRNGDRRVPGKAASAEKQ